MLNERINWLVLGANGQIGRALQSVLAAQDDVTFLTRDEADFANPQALRQTLEGMIPPRVIINAAAYTAVDKAEEEEALAFTVNADSVAELAAYAAAHGAVLVHYSSDYVFDGSGSEPRREDAPAAPLSVYGRSKRAGEERMIASGCAYLILRTSWVYDAQGKNFVNTMLRVGAEREELRVVDDQFGAPSYALHLAEATRECLLKGLAMSEFPSGIYHMCNAGETSWHGFAEAIFEEARALGMKFNVTRVVAIASSEYPVAATRPLNSRLDCSKLQQTFGVTLPDWRDALKACLFTKMS